MPGTNRDGIATVAAAVGIAILQEVGGIPWRDISSLA
jgi:hypothetical protein